MLKIKQFKTIILLLLVLAAQLPFAPTAGAAWGEPVRGKQAMVASQHELASKIGADVMKRGGNAVDAAVAVALALAVVYPEAGNLGGGGFMVIRLKDGRTTAIDYREMAPAAATRDIYVDKNGEPFAGEGSSTLGYRAAGVPGTPAGLDLALSKYGSGKMTWAQLIEPARKLAADGYVIDYRAANLFKAKAKDLARYADSKRIFLKNGKFYAEGESFKQPELAATLGRMEKSGAAEFYTGETARLIAADMKAHNGLMTLADLKNYQAKERAPVRGTYRGYPIISMPPPSSGGIALLQILKMLEKYDIRAMGNDSAAKYHVLAETMRRAFADRSEFLGDPDFVTVPTAQLLDEKYLEQRAATIDKKKASTSEEVKAGNIQIREGNETTHFTIIDPQGNVVTNTFTLNDLYGSAVTAHGTGVLLNDEMDDFAARPGKPNMFGLIQGERNAVAPGKRPLSSMTPAIVLHKDNSIWFAVGARGGPRIISASLQTIINMIDHDMNIQQAIDAPRIHHQWQPDLLYFEKYGMSADTRRILENAGYKFADAPSYVASATAIAVEDKTGIRLGAIDSRGDGAAVGF